MNQTDTEIPDKDVQLRTKVAHVPGWANFIAQDANGKWYAFFEQPYALKHVPCWLPKWNPRRKGIGISRCFATEAPNLLWQTTCRPV